MPPFGQGLEPFDIGRSVLAGRNLSRRALEDDQRLRILGELRNSLHACGTGSDDGHTLVVQPGQIPGDVTARVLIVPAARVEAVAGELLEPRDAGQLGAAEQTALGRDEPGTEHIAAVGAYRPPRRVLVPLHLGDPRLEQGVLVQAELRAEGLGVGEDLAAAGVPLRRDVTGLFEVRQVDVRLDVAAHTRVTVPVPSTAEIACDIEDFEVRDTDLLELDAGTDAHEAGADDEHVEISGLRGCGAGAVRVWIGVERGELAVEIDGLEGVGTGVRQALVALFRVFLAEPFEVVDLALGFPEVWIACCLVGGGHESPLVVTASACAIRRRWDRSP